MRTHFQANLLALRAVGAFYFQTKSGNVAGGWCPAATATTAASQRNGARAAVEGDFVKVPV